MKRTRGRSSISIATLCDQGMKRTMNEDRVLELTIGEGQGWARGVVVADGMGGAAGGERASRLVVDSLADRLRDWQVQPERLGPRFASAIQPHLTDIADGIHRRIAAAASDDNALEGMGSTMTFVAVAAGHYFGIHVGDSRAYLIRQRRAVQLTTDHVAEAGGLAQAMGLGEIEPQFLFGPITAGESLLLCTDGLTKHVDATEIAELVGAGRSPDRVAEELVRRANQRGGKDNVAVGLMALPVVSPAAGRGQPRSASVGVLAALALGAFGLLAASATAYVAYNRSGTGVPGSYSGGSGRQVGGPVAREGEKPAADPERLSAVEEAVKVARRPARPSAPVSVSSAPSVPIKSPQLDSVVAPPPLLPVPGRQPQNPKDAPRQSLLPALVDSVVPKPGPAGAGNPAPTESPRSSKPAVPEAVVPQLSKDSMQKAKACEAKKQKRRLEVVRLEDLGLEKVQRQYFQDRLRKIEKEMTKMGCPRP